MPLAFSRAYVAPARRIWFRCPTRCGREESRLIPVGFWVAMFIGQRLFQVCRQGRAASGRRDPSRTTSYTDTMLQASIRAHAGQA